MDYKSFLFLGGSGLLNPVVFWVGLIPSFDIVCSLRHSLVIRYLFGRSLVLSLSLRPSISSLIKMVSSLVVCSLLVPLVSNYDDAMYP